MTALLAGVAHGAEAPTKATVAAQAKLKAQLPFADDQDFDFARRGFVATRADPLIRRADGGVAWDLSAYDFIKGEAPASVNPSLWRQARLLSLHGLFKVSDRIWQVRGFDLANITFIQGDTGWIVIDPLTTTETARAALELIDAKVGRRKVVAVIYTHSHVDHFGGVRGVIDEKDVGTGPGDVRVIGPQGFLEEAVSENVIAGAAMSRRANFQFGHNLAPGPDGQISSGIGQAVAKGTVSFIAPRDIVSRTGQTMTVDGVELEFQYTPGTEAPAEMNIYLPQFRALCMAENANATMHNVLTPRGALVRDAKVWADDLSSSVELYGARTDVMFTSHGWPRFGREVIGDYLLSHRDAYKYLHDQTVRLMNQGYVGAEIANRIKLPPVLADQWFNRGYYGTMSFNSRAVYQRYMGWYDANPASLAVLPPAEQARRYVAAMGGAGKVRALAATAYDAADYGWAATLLNNVVQADPADRAAAEQLARTYDQLGYQAESSLWRNIYLTGAGELRGGVSPPSVASTSPDIVMNLPTAMLFDLLAIRLNPDKVGEGRTSVLFVFPERQERYLVTVRNQVLVGRPALEGATAEATLTLPRALFLQALFSGKPLAGQPGVKVEGNGAALVKMLGWFDAPKADFPIVTRPE
ncbi:MAG: MBL fold metallo-hydrolase [Caulobacteraceae bacterium]|nr:MAG: MBL fold metallo-hydrolase [Caulobacteraceae bacterium]